MGELKAINKKAELLKSKNEVDKYQWIQRSAFCNGKKEMEGDFGEPNTWTPKNTRWFL